MSDDSTQNAPAEQQLMEYIDAEVRAVCRRNDWRHQIRRKWSVREVPVSSSSIADHEWKLIPSPDDTVDGYEGTYFVLGLGGIRGTLVLQHDTHHAGIPNHNFFTCTYTVIDLCAATRPLGAQIVDAEAGEPPPGGQVRWLGPLPPQGTLEQILLALTARFQPNVFSVT